MPNYREVGKTLMALIRSYPIDDDPPSTDLTFTVDPSEGNFFAQPVLPQPELGESSHTNLLLLFSASGAEDDSPFARAKPEPGVKPQASTNPKQRSAVTTKPTPRLATQRTTSRTRTNPSAKPQVPPIVRRFPTTSSARPPTTAARTFSSQPVTRAPTSQSTMRAPSSRATTRAPSAARSTPPVRAGVAPQPSPAPCVSRLTTKPAARPTAPTAPAKAAKAATTQPNARATPVARNAAASPSCNTSSPNSPNTGRPRSGTITKAAFESNAHTHMVAHMKNNSLEDVRKDLEGLIVFEDAFDDDDGFRFDV